MAAKNAANAAAAVLPNVMTNKAGSSSAASVHIAAAQSGIQFPTNLLLSHLASGTYVLSPVSPNAPQNLIAGSPLLAPVSQQTIVTVQQNPITSGQQRGWFLIFCFCVNLSDILVARWATPALTV